MDSMVKKKIAIAKWMWKSYFGSDLGLYGFTDNNRWHSLPVKI